MGMCASWQIGAASSERLEATSPSTATTPSREINLFTTVLASPALERSSSERSWMGLPSTPPPALISSTASSVPSCEETPNDASLPVSEANSPTRMTLSGGRAAGLVTPWLPESPQPVRPNMSPSETTGRNSRKLRFFIIIMAKSLSANPKPDCRPIRLINQQVGFNHQTREILGQGTGSRLRVDDWMFNGP